MRWKKGELLTMEWNGIYVPAHDVPLDLNGDGVLDVAFGRSRPTSIPANIPYIVVSPTGDFRLSNDTSGELTWLNSVPRKWDDKKYYYPIPEPDRTANPALNQNPGW